MVYIVNISQNLHKIIVGCINSAPRPVLSISTQYQHVRYHPARILQPIPSRCENLMPRTFCKHREQKSPLSSHPRCHPTTPRSLQEEDPFNECFLRSQHMYANELRGNISCDRRHRLDADPDLFNVRSQAKSIDCRKYNHT